MKRTKLCDRQLPGYTRGEEIFNSVSHIVGAGFGVIALIVCVAVAALHHNLWGVVGSAIYGVSLITLYTISGVYHGLQAGMGKKVMQVIDHCAVYLLIAGTYTPILFSSIRPVSPVWSWVLFAIVWGLAALAAVFTAIDLKRYAKFSMACYIGMGWCIVLAAKTLIEALPLPAIVWLVAGGVSYTVGAALYGIGKKRRWMHSVFHLFVVLGSILQFVCILFYVL